MSPSANSGLTVDTDSDKDGNQTTLIFEPDEWNTFQTVEVSADRDDDAIDNTATITLSGEGVSPNSVTVTVTDNGSAAGAGMDVSSVSRELGQGGAGSFSIPLAPRPEHDGAVSLAVLNHSGITSSAEQSADTSLNVPLPTLSGLDDGRASVRDLSAMPLAAWKGGAAILTVNRAVPGREKTGDSP